MVNHHPDVSKFARETLNLKAEVKRLKGVSSGGQDLSKEVARTHKYTLQLERQLRHFLTKGKLLLVFKPEDTIMNICYSCSSCMYMHTVCIFHVQMVVPHLP